MALTTLRVKFSAQYDTNIVALHFQYKTPVVDSSWWPYSLRVWSRCPFSRLDFLIRKVGAGCRSEP